jgi:hypothetical protein
MKGIKLGAKTKKDEILMNGIKFGPKYNKKATAAVAVAAGYQVCVCVRVCSVCPPCVCERVSVATVC